MGQKSAKPLHVLWGLAELLFFFKTFLQQVYYIKYIVVQYPNDYNSYFFMIFFIVGIFTQYSLEI